MCLTHARTTILHIHLLFTVPFLLQIQNVFSKLILHAWMLSWLSRLRWSQWAHRKERRFTQKILSVMFLCLFKLCFICVCVLQVPRCAPRQRQLPTDWPVALWPHLHRLPWPATDEAAHGALTQETQVSGPCALCLCVSGFVFSLCMLLYLLLCVCCVSVGVCVCQQFPSQACRFIGCVYGLIIAGNKVYMSVSRCLTVTHSAC